MSRVSYIIFFWHIPSLCTAITHLISSGSFTFMDLDGLRILNSTCFSEVHITLQVKLLAYGSIPKSLL